MEKVEKKEFVATPIEALNDSNVKISDFLIALINFENLLQEFSESTELDIYDLNGGLVYTDDGRLLITYEHGDEAHNKDGPEIDIYNSIIGIRAATAA